MIKISRNTGNIKLTGLDLWQPTFPQLCRAFSTPKIDNDKLNAGYFLRCAGTKRGNDTVADTASLLIQDGDSHIDINGNIVAGAVNPLVVHMMLNHLNLDHFIYTSHSNKGFHAGKCDVMPFWKYRVLIPVTYTREQLLPLLNWIFEQFHKNDVMLANVKENSSWAQAWFMPCVPPERAHLFKTWWRVGGVSLDKTDTTAWFEPAPPFDVAKICADYQNKQSPVNESIPTLSTVARVPVTNLSANPIEAFNASFSVHDVLIHNGYKQQGKRYLHPNSSSGVAGVVLLNNGQVSCHDGSVLSDTGTGSKKNNHDAFSLYKFLECGGDMKTALNWNTDLTKANQRAFYESKNTPLDNVDITPFIDKVKMQNPQQNNSATGLRYSVQLPSFENFLGSQAQISTAITV
jgi:hypothetical protein